MEQVPCLLISNGEFTQITVASTGKYYSDKIKAMLSAKRHTNYVILSLSQLPFQSIKMIDVQFTIVMGLASHTFTAKYIYIYMMQKLYQKKSIFDIKYNCLITKCILMLHLSFITLLSLLTPFQTEDFIVFSLFAMTQALSPIYIFI
jgi:hypothetical protein